MNKNDVKTFCNRKLKKITYKWNRFINTQTLIKKINFSVYLNSTIVAHEYGRPDLGLKLGSKF